jgi:hypothetical protein
MAALIFWLSCYGIGSLRASGDEILTAEHAETSAEIAEKNFTGIRRKKALNRKGRKEGREEMQNAS